MELYISSARSLPRQSESDCTAVRFAKYSVGRPSTLLVFALIKQKLGSPFFLINITYGINSVMLLNRCSRSATCLYSAAFFIAIDAMELTVFINEKSAQVYAALRSLSASSRSPTTSSPSLMAQMLDMSYFWNSSFSLLHIDL